MNLSLNVPMNLSTVMPPASNTVSAVTESSGTSPSGALNDATGFGSIIADLLMPDQDPAKKDTGLESLLALMQNLSLIQLPVQEQPLEPAQTLAMVNSVLGSGTQLAELVVQDADMQAWLQNASKQLQGAAKEGNPVIIASYQALSENVQDIDSKLPTAGQASVLNNKANAAADEILVKTQPDNTAVQPANASSFPEIKVEDAKRIVKEILDSVGSTGSSDPKLQSLADRLQMVTQPFQHLLSLFTTKELSLAGGQPLETAQVNASNVQGPQDMAVARNFFVNAKPAFVSAVSGSQGERNKLSGTAVGLTEKESSAKSFDLNKLAAKSFVPTLFVSSGNPEASAALKGSPMPDDQYGLTADSSIPPAGENGSPAQIVPVQDLLKTITNEPMPGTQASRPVPVERFTEEMTGMVMKNFSLSVKDGLTETKLSLFPQHLGHVDVKLTMHNGMLTAQFAAESVVAKEMLESQLPQLKTALQNQGLQIDKLEVTQNQNYQSAGMFQEQRQSNNANFSRKPAKGRNSSTDDEAREFVSELSEAKHAAPGRWNSTSFDVTA